MSEYTSEISSNLERAETNLQVASDEAHRAVNIAENFFEAAKALVNS